MDIRTAVMSQAEFARGQQWVMTGHSSVNYSSALINTGEVMLGNWQICCIVPVLAGVFERHIMYFVFRYLRQGGYVFTGVWWSVCLPVNGNTQKLLITF